MTTDMMQACGFEVFAKTSTRVYYLRPVRGTDAWEAEYKPVNQRTGEPWQASRRLMRGRDVHVIFWWNRAGEKAVEVRPGKFELASLPPGDRMVSNYYSSRELAERAVQDDISQRQPKN